VSTVSSLEVPAATRRAPRVLTYRAASIVALLFPFTGIPALVASVQAGRLRNEGKIEEARTRAERAREWCWYSLGYGLLVYFILFIVWLFTANNHAVWDTYFGDVLFNKSAWKSMLTGFQVNITVFLWTEAIVLVWALLVASVRLLPGKACAPIRFVSAAYTDIFRALPSILVLYLIVYGLQRAALPLFDELSVVQLCILSLSLVYGAYVAEVYRAGIESIHWSQVAASRSLGLSYAQTMRHVVVPQAVRRVFPPLLNDFIGLQKDTALISVVGLLDMLARARFLNNSRATFTGYTMAAFVFLALTIPQTRAADKIIKRDQLRTRAN
jgi:polar amino acid transport system permease protein